MYSFNILGDCVTRDIITPLINSGKASVFQYHAFSNPASLFSSRGKFSISATDINTDDSNFRKRCAVNDINKTALSYVFEKPSDYIIVDFLDARLPMLKKGNHIITLSNCLISARCVLDKKFEIDSYNEISPFDDISFEQWKLQIIKICTIIKQHYPVDKIILHNHYGVDRYVDDDGIFPYTKYVPFIKKFNLLVSQLFTIAKTELSGCHIIDFPEHVLGDSKHQWGLYPLHYHNLYYEYGAKALEIIIDKLPRDQENRNLDILKNIYSSKFEKLSKEHITSSTSQIKNYEGCTINFLVSTDKNYLKYLRVLMASVYENHPNQQCKFYVLHNELDEFDLQYLSTFACKYNQNVELIKINEYDFEGLPKNSRFPVACLYLLLSHYFLPNDLQRILYLDIDTIVNGNLTDFYNLDFENNYIIATKEIFNAKDEPYYDFKSFDTVDEINSFKAAQGKYFNSGVLLLNLDKFRHNNINLEFYRDRIKDYSDVFYDQGILNICFATQTKLLTCCKYNYRISFSAKNYFQRKNFMFNTERRYDFYPIEAKIIHYCGFIMNFKPWYLHFTKSELQHYSDSFFDLIPECADILDIWWHYAKKVPDYQTLLEEQLRNKSAYKLLHNISINQNLDFVNQLGIETLTVPTYRQKNTILENEDLNNFIKPRVYRCIDGATKCTVKNLPEEFTEKCGFRLTVKHIAAYSPNGPAIIQILEPNTPVASVYRRHLSNNNSKWDVWYKNATTADLRIMANQISQLKTQNELLETQILSIISKTDNKKCKFFDKIRKILNKKFRN